MNATHTVVVKDGDTSCEVTDTHEAAPMAASPVSPAISPPVSPSTEEKNNTDSDGSKCGNKSGSKANCYECKHREQLEYSHHSRCNLFDKKQQIYMVAMPQLAALVVRGNAHGIANGWFFWPLDFDPVWLESCIGFERDEL